MTPISTQYEDYLERILEIIEEKGHVRAVEVAERLGVSKGSVSQMVGRLERDGFVDRERYRGFTLTKKGTTTAQKIRKRHEVLEEFLGLLGISDATKEKDIEGMEHSLSETTVAALEQLGEYLKQTKYRMKRPQNKNSNPSI